MFASARQAPSLCRPTSKPPARARLAWPTATEQPWVPPNQENVSPDSCLLLLRSPLEYGGASKNPPPLSNRWLASLLCRCEHYPVAVHLSIGIRQKTLYVRARTPSSTQHQFEAHPEPLEGAKRLPDEPPLPPSHSRLPQPAVGAILDSDHPDPLEACPEGTRRGERVPGEPPPPPTPIASPTPPQQRDPHPSATSSIRRPAHPYRLTGESRYSGQGLGARASPFLVVPAHPPTVIPAQPGAPPLARHGALTRPYCPHSGAPATFSPWKSQSLTATRTARVLMPSGPPA